MCVQVELPLRIERPALQWARERISPRACAAFLRVPVQDRFCPGNSDLDLIVFGEVDCFRPERMHAPDGTRLDLAWYPQEMLAAPEILARSGLAAHRFQRTELVWDLAGRAAESRRQFEACLYQPSIQADRVAVFLDMGYLTTREIGVTWDFAALALFWLQMGHAGCIAAMADAVRLACPNVFTRPFGYIEGIERATGLALGQKFVRTLRLESDPRDCIEPLRRLHRAVSARYYEPSWPTNMRRVTRAEYAYTRPKEELDWRIAVAEEMAGNGFPEAALYYLRFWAYSLARLPMVWHCAIEGRDVAFLRPERAVRPALEQHCPEILPDLTMILGGVPGLECIRQGIEDLLQLRSTTLDLLRACGINFPENKEWRPYEAPLQKSRREMSWHRCL